jgi:hypothetical protein
MNTTLETEMDILKSPYSELFHKLLKEMDECMEVDLPETDRFQNCFWICVKWNKNLKELALMNGFKSESEEIEFFRYIKPRFTCFTEFFVIASEALWFVNNKAECPSIFWKEEIEKYSRFCNRYSFFLDYYQSGKHNYDREYFLRATAEKFGDIHSKMLEDTPALRSSKDWLVRSCLAHKMYFRFAQDKLATIVNSLNAKFDNVLGNKAAKQKSDRPKSFSQLLISYLHSVGHGL